MVVSKDFLIFTPKLGEDSQFGSHFSNGLKPPTSCWFDTNELPFFFSGITGQGSGHFHSSLDTRPRTDEVFLRFLQDVNTLKLSCGETKES